MNGVLKSEIKYPFKSNNSSLEFEGADHSEYQNECIIGITSEDDSSFLMESKVSICNEQNSKEIDFNKYVF